MTMEALRKGIHRKEAFTAAGIYKTVEFKVIKEAGHVSFIVGLEKFCHTVLVFLAPSLDGYSGLSYLTARPKTQTGHTSSAARPQGIDTRNYTTR